MAEVSVAEVREGIAEYLDRASRNERIVVNKRGKPHAAIVSMSDFQLLVRIDDLLSALAAERGLKELQEKGDIAWEEVCG